MSFSDDSFQPSNPELKPEASTTGSYEAADSPRARETGQRPAASATDGYKVFGPRLGQGGQGEVIRAVQRRLARVVALKRIHSGSIGPSMGTVEVNQRKLSFFQEALITACLDHPNIVPVHDLGTDEQGRPFLAMKLIRGTPWSEVIIADRAMEPSDFFAKHLSILIDVAQATAFAHSRGIVHRDLHPGQVMVGSFGEVYLSDWGLALLYDANRLTEFICDESLGEEVIRDLLDCERAPRPSQARGPAGSPAYLAPEQARLNAAGVGPWTDVYLLGGILYYLLADCVPHPEVTREYLDKEVEIGPVVSLKQRAGGRHVPEELATLCQACLSSVPGDRPSAEVLIQGLRDYLSGSSRRHESNDIADAVENALGEAAGRSYDFWSARDREIRRALELWGENQRARELHNKVLAIQARLAIQNNDLQLALSLARELPAGDEAVSLNEDIRVAFSRRARHRRQRVAALAASAILVLIVVLVAWGMAAERSKRTFISQLSVLVGEEAGLADKVHRIVALPTVIHKTSYDLAAGDEDPPGLGETLQKLEQAAARRQALAAIAGDQMPEPPLPVLWGEALLRLQLEKDERGYPRVIELLQHVMKAEQSRGSVNEMPIALMGLAIVDIRESRHDEGMRKLEEAREILAGLDRNDFKESRSVFLLMQGAFKIRTDDTGEQGLEWEELQQLLEREWMTTGRELAEYYYSIDAMDESDSVTIALWQGAGESIAKDNYLSASLHDIRGKNAAKRGDHDVAIEFLQKAIDIFRSDPNLNHLDLAYDFALLSEMLVARGSVEEAAGLAEEALAMAQVRFGKDDWELGYFHSRLAYALQRAHRNEESIVHGLEAIRLLEGTRNDHGSFAALTVADSLINLKRWEEALKFLEPHLQTWSKSSIEKDARRYIIGMLQQARIYKGLEREDEALDSFIKGLDHGRNTIGLKDPLAWRCAADASRMVVARKDGQGACDIIEPILQANEGNPGFSDSMHLSLLVNLINAYSSLELDDLEMSCRWELVETLRTMESPTPDFVGAGFVGLAGELQERKESQLAHKIRVEGARRLLAMNGTNQSDRMECWQLLDGMIDRAHADRNEPAAMALMHFSIAQTNRRPDLFPQVAGMYGRYLSSLTIERSESERDQITAVAIGALRTCEKEGIDTPSHDRVWIRAEAELALVFKDSADDNEKVAAGLLAARALSMRHLFIKRDASLITQLEQLAEVAGTSRLVKLFHESSAKPIDMVEWLDSLADPTPIHQAINRHAPWDGVTIPPASEYTPIIHQHLEAEWKKSGPATRPDWVVALPWKTTAPEDGKTTALEPAASGAK